MKLLSKNKRSQATAELYPDPVMSTVLDVDMISQNPNQPRKSFDEVGLVTLADSIRQHGLLQPISVRRVDVNEEIDADYVIIAGERRYRAMQMLGMREIPCLVIDISAREAAELAIIENIMRKDLSMFELAEAFSVLLTEFELTQEELGKRLSTSQSNIANKLRLLRFSPKERFMIEEYQLTERHARSLIRIQDEELRFKVLLYACEHHLSLKATESYVERLLMPKKQEKSQKSSISCADALDLIQSVIKKPLSKLNRRGLQVTTEEFDDDTHIKVMITIPKDVSRET